MIPLNGGPSAADDPPCRIDNGPVVVGNGINDGCAFRNAGIIGKAGKPVAKLVRYERSEEPRSPGALKGEIKIADDFDELPDDITEAFGMKPK